MNILSIIGPLILVALLGFICTKSRWLQRSQLDSLTKFTFYISIPTFLFYKMVNADFSQHVNLALFAAFYLPVLLCYFIAFLTNFLFHGQLKKHPAPSATFALGASYSNTVIVGLPVLLAALGEQVVAIVFLIVTFHSAILFAITSALSSHKQQFSWRIFLKQTFNNPIIIGILSGLIFNLLAIELHQVVIDSLLLVGEPAVPLALFILGASMTFYQVKNEVRFIAFAATIKLFILPSLVFISSHFIFELDAMITTVLVILSASPTGINAYLIAKSHSLHQETVAGTVMVTTLACTITLPIWLWFLK